LHACAALASNDSGRAADELLAAYEKTLANPSTGYLIGAFAADGHLLGFARTLFLDSHDVESARPVPVGWYLLGVNVDQRFRRHGVGTALTHARLLWLKERSREVFYVARADNLASIAMHQCFGFERIGEHYVLKPNICGLSLFRLNFVE
jgi:ribosomal protein S18 acetylase RimI-like enzyme